MTVNVVVVGAGLMTAVGLSSSETASSVRAGTARFVESTIFDKRYEPFTIAEVPQDGLPVLAEFGTAQPLTSREQRMLRLAVSPLRECAHPLGNRPLLLSLCLALPEIETTRPIDRSTFLRALAVQTGSIFDPDRSDASHTGRAGGMIAVGQAVQTIIAGSADFIIAGGVDTYRDPYVLATLDREERVKSSSNWDGFIPGEAAAFLLLASESAATARGLTTLARISPVAIGFEAGHLYSDEAYKGDGLAGTFARLVQQGAVDAPIADVYSTMTGESHWAKEWGVAVVRTKPAFRDSCAIHHPADCCGDTGAASGPLSVALAALGIQSGYRRSPALAYASSDRGGRAAVIVHS
jgi:3-oxoacyl-[acyl-carrier-protein] synthase-1